MSASTGGRMPLIEHLRELRSRLFKSIIVIALATTVTWFFYNDIITQLAKPVCDLKFAQETGAESCGALYISGVLGPLNLQIKVAILSGIIVAAPVWLYQLWAFIAPALHRKEKRNSIFFIIAATPFFAAGAFLGYTILPIAVEVLFGFTPDALNNLVKFDDYLDFVMRAILLFGIAFELPVFLITFNLIGFLSGKAILKPWRGWVFGITLFVAAFSPTADPLSMMALAVPLILLYLFSGVFALFNDRRRARKSETL
jgi:sec-independent protein translocase protein TatC